MTQDAFRRSHAVLLCATASLVGACSLAGPLDYAQFLRERQPQLEALAHLWASQPARDVIFFGERTIRWDETFIDHRPE